MALSGTGQTIIEFWHKLMKLLGRTMSPAANILCYGKNPVLLKTREAVLAKRYDVTVVYSLDEIANIPAATQFDVLLLCHSLSTEDCHACSEIARHRWPKCKVVALTASGSGCANEQADRNLPGLDGPTALLSTIQELTQTPRSPGNLASI